jgi:hypothetical protein
MRYIHRAVLASALLPFGLLAQDASRSVAGGGISVPGWKGQIDSNEARRGSTIENAKFEKQGNGFHVVTGPAVTYWHEGDTASGNYTVKATFTEPKFMNLNTHPHPYGLMIGGGDMGTPNETLLYCAAYGTGNFIVRGFGPAPFQLNGREGEENAAVHHAPGKDQAVTQEIAISVKGDKVSCLINGTAVGTYDKSAVVGTGKLKSTDGVYGLRFAHNTEVTVTGFSMTKN